MCSRVALIVPLALVFVSPASTQAQTQLFGTEVVASGLVTPWSLAFAPDGRLFIAERPGRIRLVQRGQLQAEPWTTLPAYDSARSRLESGLMGLAVDPQFPAQPYLYACYSYKEGDKVFNRIVRLTERNGRGSDEKILLDGMPGGAYHNGCRLKFGPDGKLYATTGDAYVEALGQDTASPAGKVLRMNPDGSVPGDNPIPGSLIWSLGHRNPQGMAWEPGTNRLFVPEHGTGEIDELNLVERGGNYGWPVARGMAHDPRYRDPVLILVAAPTGATFITGHRYPALPPGLLAVTSLSGERLLLITPGHSEATIYADSALTGLGRLRDAVMGPDGYLYISTSNRDGRGRPAEADDRVLRLLPAGR